MVMEMQMEMENATCPFGLTMMSAVLSPEATRAKYYGRLGCTCSLATSN